MKKDIFDLRLGKPINIIVIGKNMNRIEGTLSKKGKYHIYLTGFKAYKVTSLDDRGELVKEGERIAIPKARLHLAYI